MTEPLNNVLYYMSLDSLKLPVHFNVSWLVRLFIAK